MSELKLAGKLYNKNHPLVFYYNSLSYVQGSLYCLPTSWGDFEPREYANQLIGYMIRSLEDRTPRSTEMYIQELSTWMVNQVEYISGGLTKYEGIIGTNDQNQEFSRLRTDIMMAESYCLAAKSYIELNEKETSPNLLHMLKVNAAALETMAEWLYSFFWVYSTEENGRVLNKLRIVLWDEDKIKTINE